MTGGSPPDTHNGVADELFGHAAESFDTAADVRVVDIQIAAHVFGIAVLRSSCEPHKVTESTVTTLRSS